MELLIGVALIVVVVWLIARAASAPRRPDPRAVAISEAQEAVHEFAEGLRQTRAELEAAMSELSEPPPLARSRSRRGNASLDAVLRMKASPPNPTRRHGYWTAPPAPIVDDQVVIDRMKAVSHLGQPVEICFTGWTDDEKAQLRADALAAGCTARSNIAKHLTFLCVGETPGPIKLDEAVEHGVAVISGDQFSRIVCGAEARGIPF